MAVLDGPRVAKTEGSGDAMSHETSLQNLVFVSAGSLWECLGQASRPGLELELELELEPGLGPELQMQPKLQW